jgi:hypothetical protein
VVNYVLVTWLKPVKRRANYLMNAHTRDEQVTCGSILLAERPLVVKGPCPFSVPNLPADRAIVSDAVLFIAVCDFDIIFKVIYQGRAPAFI